MNPTNPEKGWLYSQAVKGNIQPVYFRLIDTTNSKCSPQKNRRTTKLYEIRGNISNLLQHQTRIKTCARLIIIIIIIMISVIPFEEPEL